MGVILNLAVWFALHVLFDRVREARWAGLSLDVPQLASLNAPAAVLMIAAAVAAFRFRVGVIPMLLACSAAGVVWFAVTRGVPARA